jgi:hypothetical protein
MEAPMKPLETAALVVTMISAGLLAGCSREPVTAARLAAELNKRVTLPQDLGDGFRLDAIVAEGNAIVSTVTLTDDSLAADPRFKDVMRTATRSDICREIAPAMQSYVDAGLTIAKVYKGPQGAEILRVEVRPGECG